MGGSGQGGGGGQGGGVASPCNPGSIREIQDNFDDGTIDANKWSSYCIGGSIKELSGNLFITPSEFQPSTCAYSSYALKSLIDCRTNVQLLQVMSENVIGNTFFELEGQPTGVLKNAVLFHVDQGNLYAIHVEKNVIHNLCSAVSYDKDKHAYLQMRESAGQLIFDTSEDGLSWDVFCIIPAPPFLNAVKLNIGTNVFSTGIQVGAAKFDKVNLP